MQKDAIRPWFEAVQNDNEFIGIRFGRVIAGSRAVEWQYYPHSDFDGIGAFARILNEGCGIDPDLQQIPHPRKESWLCLLKSVPRFAAPRKRIPWKPLTNDSLPAKPSSPPPAVDYHAFTEEETWQLRQVSRSRDVTVNSFLLKQLDRAVRPYLADPSSYIPWMVPVNMRGKVSRPDPLGNHTSYVALRILASHNARKVHEMIYEALQRGDHWAHWKAFQATQSFSEAMRQWAIRHDFATSQWNLGAFSNLGVWNAPDDLPESLQGDWLFCPPVFRWQQLGAGCLTFNGRLTLTLQLHPELTTCKEAAEEIMNRWVQEIRVELPHPEIAKNGS